MPTPTRERQGDYAAIWTFLMLKVLFEVVESLLRLIGLDWAGATSAPRRIVGRR
ncbi:hypothetical protein [Neotabrizicola sp. VNH66]|uniref:hypothetical protein n=1 Tax=Neotabrizicola sp. VNH66 TaxID=3400918 RepID=UPI003C0C69D5